MKSQFAKYKSKSGVRFISNSKKMLWLTLGLLALFLGVLGAFLPLLPTTPFIILAAFAFGKSIPVWRKKLEANKIFGPIIKDWEQKGAIAPRYKVIATIMMIAVLLLSVYLSLNPVIIVVQAVCMFAAFFYIYTRPNGIND